MCESRQWVKNVKVVLIMRIILHNCCLVVQQDYVNVITFIVKVYMMRFLPFLDRYVIVGGHHHTAHTYNRQEWASSTAIITTFIRALMLRVKRGWRPDRTIVFCSWGGTAFGNIGSYEWGEVNVHY